jgi:hypothetical protein
MTFVIALVAVAVLLFIALMLSVCTRRERQNLGLDPGIIVAADHAQLAMPTLRSDRLGLIGRPDHSLRCGNYLIPVEQKPNAGRAHPSHAPALQLVLGKIPQSSTYGLQPLGPLDTSSMN